MDENIEFENKPLNFQDCFDFSPEHLVYKHKDGYFKVISLKQDYKVLTNTFFTGLQIKCIKVLNGKILGMLRSDNTMSFYDFKVYAKAMLSKDLTDNLCVFSSGINLGFRILN